LFQFVPFGNDGSSREKTCGKNCVNGRLTVFCSSTVQKTRLTGRNPAQERLLSLSVRRDSMIPKAVAGATIFAVYVFTMFFIAAIPNEIIQTAGTQVIDASVIK
jgi:hypothetical protein